jgi:polyphosphate kinase 2 (PPK2 family)
MKKILLKNVSTKPPKDADKVDMLIKTAEMREEIIALQQKFFADGKHALLLILQGMDASGKDGVVRHVFEGVNPAGIQVHSWGKPTVEEYAHDYLWRLHKVAPKK